MKKIIVSAIGMLAFTATASAETWSLQQCVDYAVSHNLTVRSSRLQSDQGELEVTAAKNAFLPNLSASANEGLNFGRGLTSENTYANRNTTNFQWGVSLSVPLFNGLQDVRQLKLAKSQLSQYLLDYEAAKDDITLNVISQYLQVLYSKEVTESARAQLAYSTYEVERMKALVAEGKEAEATIYDVESQQAQDRLQVITAENDVRVALVTLANLLQLPSADNFDVAPLDDADPVIPGPDIIYSRALECNSSILSARQGIEVAKDQVSVAKAGYIPRINFNASTGSSYYTIIDGFSTRNNVRRARLQETSARLELDRRESELYKSIQLAYTQATGARDKYVTAGETLEKTRLSFDATREKYNLGRATSYDFEQAKNNLFRVEVGRIQAHYEYLLRYRILRFYESRKLL